MRLFYEYLNAGMKFPFLFFLFPLLTFKASMASLCLELWTDFFFSDPDLRIPMSSTWRFFLGGCVRSFFSVECDLLPLPCLLIWWLGVMVLVLERREAEMNEGGVSSFLLDVVAMCRPSHFFISAHIIFLCVVLLHPTFQCTELFAQQTSWCNTSLCLWTLKSQRPCHLSSKPLVFGR